ncbi:hypothetical protein LTR84_010670 [Exophiala bonariae]|uniref:Xylanolytic transcriptional activator regulatory domain-containing protein n=1 Tax=Exophiala bonariae TaxID=1690606 RepID=A0AAV9MUA1_9EURO|nr:hypothetical protein LTR84_010670 [Exophiala bonariae]
MRAGYMLPEEVAQTRTPTPEYSSRQTLETSTKLFTFVEHGMANSEWQHFSHPTRAAFIGTSISNIATLVRNESPSNLIKHFPFPAHKKPLPWKPKPGVLPSTVSDDILQDMGCLPTREVRDALVDAYFQHIHPTFPVIVEQRFRLEYADPRHPPPLVLLQAVLLVGAHVSDHPLVRVARSSVKSTLYRRTRELFRVRYENDRLYLVQAALLMTWYEENGDDITCNLWAWTGVATRIAYGMGVHRELPLQTSHPMPIDSIRRYHIVWWALFYTETFAALHFGRPCAIRSEDCDVPDLVSEDYLDLDENMDNTIRRDCFELNVALSHIAQDAMRLFAPRPLTLQTCPAASLGSRLAALAVKLPVRDDPFSCQTRLNYHLVLLHSHRMNRHGHLQDEMRDEGHRVRSEAASAMLSILEIMVARDHIRQCHFTCITALLAIVVQCMEDIKLAIQTSSVILASGAHAKLGRILSPAKEIATYWPINAESILKMCQRQHEKFGAIIQNYVEEPSPRQPMGQGGVDDGFWTDLFSAYDGVDFGQDLSDFGWMNVSSTGEHIIPGCEVSAQVE